MVEDSEVGFRVCDKINTKDCRAAMEEVNSPRTVKQAGSVGVIETRAPIESVKAAVSKFGGIVDWKAHRIQTVERNKSVVEELEEVQEEIVQYKKRSEEAVETEFKVLKQLENTKHQIEELELALERAQSEEQQAKQDSELAMLRLNEIEQEINEENDVVAELEAAIAEHAAAALELKSIKEELETLHKEFASLVSEKDVAAKNADDAVAASKEAEKALEELTVELVVLKKSLESAQAAHVEAEERRLIASLAKEQDCSNWKKELDDAEKEISGLKSQLLSVEDLKSNVHTASTLLLDLKAEMASYMESILKEEISDEGEIVKDEVSKDITKQSVVDSTKRELEEVKLNIEKAIAEVECLKMAATSLKSELEGEKSAMATIKQREAMPAVAAASLEAELEKNISEIVVAEGNTKEATENMTELTVQLKQAAQEADQAKSLAAMAREELQEAKIEAEKAKEETRTMETRLLAAQKEIEAANASKMLALAAIEALEKSGSAETANENPPTEVTISLEEYDELSKCARQAEEKANIRVTEAICRIEAMKESEAKTLEMLEEVSRELVTRQEAMKAAIKKADDAKEGKLAAEQELRVWRTEQEQQRKESESGQEVALPTTSPRISSEVMKSTDSDHAAAPAPKVPSSKKQMQKISSKADSLTDSKDGKKKKKSFFPKMLTLLGKQKSNRNKSS